MSRPQRFLLSAAIVNHDQNRETLAQLKALHDDSPELFEATEWIVVQNGGPILNLASVLSRRADCVKVLTTRNRGYGRAVNDAARRTTAPTLLALNADLTPSAGFLREAHAAAERLLATQGANRVGITGFRLLDNDGTVQGSFGPWPTLLRMVTGLVRPRASRKYWPPTAVGVRTVPWATGACMLFRREFFDLVRGFDERFFMYYEDVDLCRRAWRTGWKVVYDPRPTARHYMPYHGRALTHEMAKMARRSALLYFWKHRPRWEFHALVRIVRFECWRGRSDPGWQEVSRVVERAILHPDEILEWAP